jgi:hypothetical protein
LAIWFVPVVTVALHGVTIKQLFDVSPRFLSVGCGTTRTVVRSNGHSRSVGEIEEADMGVVQPQEEPASARGVTAQEVVARRVAIRAAAAARGAVAARAAAARGPEARRVALIVTAARESAAEGSPAKEGPARGAVLEAPAARGMAARGGGVRRVATRGVRRVAPREVRAGRVRLTRRGRAVLVSVVAVALLAGLWLTAGRGAVATPSGVGRAPAGSARETVTIGPGDTLWTVAARSRPGVDPRITVQRIMDVNGLADPIVHPGQRLRMPSR